MIRLPTPSWHKARCVLYYVIPIALFLLLRFPVAMHSAGGQDEQFFSVPGWTVAREGIPRIPYAPTRRRETFFENADKCLMALPPALFYVQAPFFWVCEPGYPTARLPLIVAGVGAIALAITFVKQARGRWGAACFAGCMLALSRPLLFTGTMARPDLACMLFGWLAVSVLWYARLESGWRRFALAGAAAGLGGLFHPFALVFCIQCGVWCLLVPGTWQQRLCRAFVFSVAVVLVMCLWLPLIWSFPYEFSSQFGANVLERSGPGILSRILFPRDSLMNHAILVWQFLGPFQAVLFAFGTLGSLIALFRRRDPARHRWLLLMSSSIYLSATVAGIHPTKGYWVYAWFWFVVLLAIALSPLLELSTASSRLRIWLQRGLVYAVFLGVLFPGGGLKSSYVYLTYWGDPRFHAGHFIDALLSELPRDGTYYSDSAFVFDIYLTGRDTLLCQPKRLYWGIEPLQYRMILIAAEGGEYGFPLGYDAVYSETLGSRDLPQSCFVDIYIPRQESP